MSGDNDAGNDGSESYSKPGDENQPDQWTPKHQWNAMLFGALTAAREDPATQEMVGTILQEDMSWMADPLLPEDDQAALLRIYNALYDDVLRVDSDCPDPRMAALREMARVFSFAHGMVKHAQCLDNQE